MSLLDLKKANLQWLETHIRICPTSVFRGCKNLSKPIPLSSLAYIQALVTAKKKDDSGPKMDVKPLSLLTDDDDDPVGIPRKINPALRHVKRKNGY